jgi:hypothetical protein
LNNNLLAKPKKKRKYIRFESKSPNELWQIDLKVIENEGIWLISIFDNHSRYVYHLSKYGRYMREDLLSIYSNELLGSLENQYRY